MYTLPIKKSYKGKGAAHYINSAKVTRLNSGGYQPIYSFPDGDTMPILLDVMYDGNLLISDLGGCVAILSTTDHQYNNLIALIEECNNK